MTKKIGRKKVRVVIKSLDYGLVKENKMSPEEYHAISHIINAKDFAQINKQVYELALNHFKTAGVELKLKKWSKQDKEGIYKALLTFIELKYASYISQNRKTYINTRIDYAQRKAKKKSAKANKGIIKCSICNKSFKTNAQCKQHKMAKHSTHTNRQISELANSFRRERIHAEKIKKANSERNKKYKFETSADDAIFKVLPGSYESSRKR